MFVLLQLSESAIYFTQDTWADAVKLFKAQTSNFLKKNVFFSLGYKVTNKSVAMLDGIDEGINMWYAVNLLTGTVELKIGIPSH